VLAQVIRDLRLNSNKYRIRIDSLWWLLLTSKPFPQIWVLEIENLEQRSDVSLVHGADMLVYPGPEHQVQLQEPSLLAPVHQTVDEAAAALVGGEVDGYGSGVLLGGVGGGDEAVRGGGEESAGGRRGEDTAELERPAEESGRHGKRGEEERWIAKEGRKECDGRRGWLVAPSLLHKSG
jgi:hypothetical protein